MVPKNDIMRSFAFAVLAAALPFSLHGAYAATVFTASEEKTHVEVIRARTAAYRVEVGGRLDMDNTMTREHGTRRITFQNNVSLTIANTGSTPVVNPRVVVNDRGRWWNVDELVAEFTRGARDDQERVYLIWENMRENMHHDAPLMEADFHDPVRMVNIYGGGLCDDAGACGSALFNYMGFNKANGGQDPFNRTLHGHMQCEVFLDGDHQFMDIDQDAFFLDRENRKPVSGDACARDHDLAKREMPYGPPMGAWTSAESNAALFGIDDGRAPYGLIGHRMDYTLRPGEGMIFRWDNIGKYSYVREGGPHRYFGNSKIIYEPPLDATLADYAEAMDGFEAEAGALRVKAPDAHVAIAMTTCYTVCGATVSATCSGGGESSVFRIESSTTGADFTAVWQGSGEGPHAPEASLDEALPLRGHPPFRAHYVRFVAANAEGATLSAIRIETDITASPMALPRLRVGENRVEYQDDTEGAHEVTVSHRWIECADVTLPEPPAEPVSPRIDETVHATFVEFRWPAVEDCDAYHIRVSRREDLAYPYRPNYDLIVPANEHCIPRRGMFSPGETYYWRVRPRLASGVWGAWSPTWRFEWNGPMVPTDVAHTEDGLRIVITWKPNARGTRPARYDVFGSDERGFSVSREPYQVLGRGEVLPNFLASTSDMAMIVVDPDAEAPNANKAFYRVVAVDADGVESCPSDLIELPTPFIYSRPPRRAVVGQPYEYQVRTLMSIGDLQSRYVDPRLAFREKEAYAFEYPSGVRWLALDPATGLLHGTPTGDDLGVVNGVIRATASYPDEVAADSINGNPFQNRRTRPDLQFEAIQMFSIEVVTE
ncbi:MAG TPA: Ig domain-containing protein [Candidatus Hydrogenedentes bacterium]|nr:Ig domain-containing protein [Candidatus Hydrogenedentota bacterium]HPG68961.1 Ig domain-containing protein [Candidatus Hydrogenedentota bacterium]